MVAHNISTSELKNFVAIQPVAVAINTPDCLMMYKSGVFKEDVLKESNCICSVYDPETNKPMITHAVTIVGYSSDLSVVGCNGWWIVRNSWGVEWGQNGYFNLCIPSEVNPN